MLRFPETLALIAGVASATGFAPLGLWPVTLIALALVMHLIAAAPNWRGAFTRGWWFGVGQFTLGLNWIAHAFDFQDAMPHWFGYGAVLLLSLYLAVYPAVAAGLAWWAAARASSGKLPFILCFTAGWIVTEYLRATMFTGFAWNPLGVAMLTTPLSPAATLVGTYGLSACVVLLAGSGLLAVARRWPEAVAVAVLAVLPAIVAAALVPAAPAVRALGPRIRIVQPNVSQAERHDRNSDEDSVRRLERLTGPPSAAPRLILWPEAAVPYYLEEEEWARYRLAKLLGPRDLLLTGGTTLNYDKQGDLTSATNSLFMMTADALLLDRYDKAHLVPYGEYLPLRPLLSRIGLSKLVQSDVDFVPGAAPRTMTLPGFGRVGVQICYEIIFSGQVIDRADRPDFIFNPSTDAWFGRWGPPQHLAQARLRAIEEGLPVVRATPTGISAVIDADGRLLAALPLGKAGFLDTRLPPPHAPTLFARLGNAIPLGLALLLALLSVALARFGRYGRART